MTEQPTTAAGPRLPRAEDGTTLNIGDALIGHGAVTGVVWPIGVCLTCGRVVDIEAEEEQSGHDPERHRTRTVKPETEARQQNGSALRIALERLSIALMNANIEPRWSVSEAFDTVQRAALATLPPSAPLAVPASDRESIRAYIARLKEQTDD